MQILETEEYYYNSETKIIPWNKNGVKRIDSSQIYARYPLLLCQNEAKSKNYRNQEYSREPLEMAIARLIKEWKKDEWLLRKRGRRSWHTRVRFYLARSVARYRQMNFRDEK